MQQFREVWAVDFEFSAPPGDRPDPVCLVAWELNSGRKLRLWEDELAALKQPPYAVGENALLVAYYASAELSCHLALGWPLPVKVLDLYAEFRNQTNGLPLPCGSGLLGALVYYGLGGIAAADKESMRQLAMRGGPWTEAEKQALLDYCEADVAALADLLPNLQPRLDIPRALLRGRYMRAAAHIEYTGIPLDTDLLARLREHWQAIQERLVSDIGSRFGVYEGRTFKTARFAGWLTERGIPWPRLATGVLDLCADTFQDMARTHPAVAPLHELRVTLAQLRLSELSVGKDGRNRCLLSAFRARTGRNQPSNSQYIFGPAVWLRGLIKPAPGDGLAYLDWAQQEFGIAAALSGDPAMQDAYRSGDPYLEFAKQAGAVPQDATRESHGAERDQFKLCALAVQYGMEAESLAQRLGQPTARARELLRLHRQIYQVFWAWSDGVANYAFLHGRLWTVFGWDVRVGTAPNPRSLRNFPMQANGAEMLRLACCLAVERGIRVCAPVHDALLIEAPLGQLERAIKQTQQAMSDASAFVLGGFRLNTEAVSVRYPDRYQDKRGVEMWNTVQDVLAKL